MFRTVLAILVLALATPTLAQQVGEVVQLVGAGKIDRAGTKIALAVGTGIHADDIIATAPTGRVKMKFADETELTLGGDGEIVIDEFVYKNAPDDSAIFKLEVPPLKWSILRYGFF
ncbi:MAG: hypothetical protein FJX59_17130 [Alphaproteobacteria bacterium]|nr:hypothetical protein [Alphaproteobacteria bacterium]